MLYGSEELQRRVITEARKFALENKLKIIWGAMVGSVSKGLHYADSDYDTRFLFVREDFPNKICYPWEMEENELVYRYYPEDKLIYEWIPCWELTSFLQFLLCPSFKDDFSCGLYNIVGWTFLSPYVWDPYGLQNKILPLINSVFVKEYEVAYHIKVLNKYWKEYEIGGAILAKTYLYMIHAAMTIEWSVTFNTQPYIYIDTLAKCCAHGDFAEKVRSIALKARRESIDNYTNAHMTDLHDSHFSIYADRDKELDKYILKMYEVGKRYASDGPIKKSDEIKAKKTIDEVYVLIGQSISEFENRELLFS